MIDTLSRMKLVPDSFKNPVSVKLFSILMAMLFMLGRPCVGSAAYPAPTMFEESTDQIFVATDQGGHAVAAYTSTTSGRIFIYYFSDNAWESKIFNYIEGNVKGVAMSPAGTALVTYVTPSFELRSLYFDGNVWFMPNLNPIGMVANDGSGGGGVVMGSNGLGVTIWADPANEIHIAYFSGAWGPPSPDGDIGTGFNPVIDMFSSSAGIALVAGWNDFSTNEIIVRNNYANTWFSVNNLGLGVLGGVGISRVAISVAAFIEDVTGDVYGSIFNGGGTLDSTTFLGTTDTDNVVQVDMGEPGIAVVTWSYNAVEELYYAQFDGSAWDSTVNFQSGISTTSPAVSVNSDGNAVLFWGEFTPDVDYYTARLQSQGTLEPPELVASTNQNFARSLAVSLANNGWFNALVWWDLEIDVSDPTPYGVASIQLPAPTGLEVSECPNRNADSQGVCFNRITWESSGDPEVASYNIERNGVFIANVPETENPEFTDGDSPCGAYVVYSIAAVDQGGVPGLETSITLE